MHHMAKPNVGSFFFLNLSLICHQDRWFQVMIQVLSRRVFSSSIPPPPIALCHSLSALHTVRQKTSQCRVGPPLCHAPGSVSDSCLFSRPFPIYQTPVRFKKRTARGEDSNSAPVPGWVGGESQLCDCRGCRSGSAGERTCHHTVTRAALCPLKSQFTTERCLGKD